MAEQIHVPSTAYFGRWDDADKKWDDASVMLGAHIEAAVIADVIVDTPEEIEALPDEQEVVVPVENVTGPVVKVDESEAEGEGEGDDANDPDAPEEDPAEPTDPKTEE